MAGIEKVLIKERPDTMQGDTNTVLAGAFSGRKKYDKLYNFLN